MPLRRHSQREATHTAIAPVLTLSKGALAPRFAMRRRGLSNGTNAPREGDTTGSPAPAAGRRAARAPGSTRSRRCRGHRAGRGRRPELLVTACRKTRSSPPLATMGLTPTAATEPAGARRPCGAPPPLDGTGAHGWGAAGRCRPARPAPRARVAQRRWRARVEAQARSAAARSRREQLDAEREFFVASARRRERGARCARERVAGEAPAARSAAVEIFSRLQSTGASPATRSRRGEKGLDALRALVAIEAGDEELALGVELFAPAAPARRMHELLDARLHLERPARQPLRPLSAAAQASPGGTTLLTTPQPCGQRCAVQGVPSSSSSSAACGGGARASELGGAAVGRQAHGHEGGGELRVFGRHDQVAGQGQREAASGRRALDRGDDRLRRRLDRVDPVVQRRRCSCCSAAGSRRWRASRRRSPPPLK